MSYANPDVSRERPTLPATHGGRPGTHPAHSSVWTDFNDYGAGVILAPFIARRRDLQLQRVDLSAAVNKYIGETEKNLRRLLRTANHRRAVLFFDEGSSSIGKRTRVKDTTDRPANQDIVGLLQRFEGSDGLAMIAMDCEGELDASVVRRFRYIVSADAGTRPRSASRPAVSDTVWGGSKKARLPGGPGS